MPETFESLADMQVRSCVKFSSNQLFGTKREGVYTWTTYSEFAERVDCMRGALAELGVGKDDKVGAIANNREEWAVCAYATYGRGAHWVPMYEAQLPKDWKYILEDSGAVVLFVATEAIYEKVRGFVGKVGSLRHVVCFETTGDANHSYVKQLEIGKANPVAVAELTGDDIAGLIYTSGTTGEPKGVILSHGNFTSNVNAVHQIFPIQPDDVSLSFLPWAHSFGQTVELHTLLSMGAGLGIAESVATLMDNFQEVRPTLLFAVPRIFNRIYDGLKKKMAAESAVKRFMFAKGLDVARQRRELEDAGQRSVWIDWQYEKFDKLVFSKVKARFGGRLKYAFSGGAALSKEVGMFIDDVGVLVFEGYGLTETSPIATANRPGARRIGTIGKVIPGVEVYICDENGGVLDDEIDGEICIVGPNVMQGYNNKPEATAAVMFEIDGEQAFRSGDMGRRSADGFIQITGRFKEQYKLENGKYVVPSPLEEQLQLSGFINQVCVYGDNRPYNIALVVPDFDAIKQWASEHGVESSDAEALAKSDRVLDKLTEEVATYGVDFKAYEKPRKLVVVADEFSPENEQLTPTLKLKRRNVIAAYKARIDSAYATK